MVRLGWVHHVLPHPDETKLKFRFQLEIMTSHKLVCFVRRNYVGLIFVIGFVIWPFWLCNFAQAYIFKPLRPRHRPSTLDPWASSHQQNCWCSSRSSRPSISLSPHVPTRNKIGLVTVSSWLVCSSLPVNVSRSSSIPSRRRIGSPLASSHEQKFVLASTATPLHRPLSSFYAWGKKLGSLPPHCWHKRPLPQWGTKTVPREEQKLFLERNKKLLPPSSSLLMSLTFFWWEIVRDGSWGVICSSPMNKPLIFPQRAKKSTINLYQWATKGTATKQ